MSISASCFTGSPECILIEGYCSHGSRNIWLPETTGYGFVVLGIPGGLPYVALLLAGGKVH